MGILFPVFFFMVFGLFIFVFVKLITEWDRNNKSPRLTVPVVVVSKREDWQSDSSPVGGDASGAHGYHTTWQTYYYITFQVESGDRMEFCVSGSEYGMIAERDEGKLTFQGTRFLSFERG